MNTEIALPWIEKYRPKTLSQVISHDDKVNMLRNALVNREIPHLLFYGSPGTGKTSLILALIKEMYGNQFRRFMLELNASDKRGIQVVRDDIKKFAQTKSSDLKFIILDEADAMTSDAQDALRRIIEKYSKTCRFCLICNNSSKIINAIKSRCFPMRFSVLSKDAIKIKLIDILQQENVTITDTALQYILNIDQDFRQILNTLQCLKCLKNGDIINDSDVIGYMGKPDQKLIAEIVHVLDNESFKVSYKYLLALHRQNRISILEFIKELAKYVINSDFDDERIGRIIDSISNVEYRIINGNDTEIQLAGLVSAWLLSKNST